MKRALGGALALALVVLAAGAGWWLRLPASDDRPVKAGRIADGVHAVLVGDVLAYVVQVTGGAVLVDAGPDPEAAEIRAQLAALGDPPVVAILLTDGRPDHTAGCAAFPGVPVVVHRDEPDPSPCVPSQRAVHGTRASFGRFAFEGYHLPGHTPGSMGWLGRRVLFLGDAARSTTDGRVEVPRGTADPERARASLAALYPILPAREVKRLAFGRTGSLGALEPLAALAE